MDVKALLKIVKEKNASDLHLTVGVPPTIRVEGKLLYLDLPPLQPADTQELIQQLLEGRTQLLEVLENNGEIDFAYSINHLGRFRINVFKQRGNMAAALRFIDGTLPTMEELGLPRQILQSLAEHTRGLVLVTGPTGSGKSTTLATMIDYINEKYHKHILTLEDPIEFIHMHKNSIINEREIGMDSQSYSSALRAALREDPDVIFIGEMRDPETIMTAITAAETGHLVLSTLHTMGAVSTIERIVDIFPSDAKQQIRMQLASILKGVISQQLVPRNHLGGRTVALEIMLTNSAISSLIREQKYHQIYSQIQTGAIQGMITMDASLIKLYKAREISLEVATYYAQEKEEFKCLLGHI